MRLHLLDLLDTVLQNNDGGVLITQPGQPAFRVGVLGGFGCQQDNSDRAGDLGGIGAHRAWYQRSDRRHRAAVRSAVAVSARRPAPGDRRRIGMRRPSYRRRRDRQLQYP